MGKEGWEVHLDTNWKELPQTALLKVSSGGQALLAVPAGEIGWVLFYLDDGEVLWKSEYEKVYRICLSETGETALLTERGFGIIGPDGEGTFLGAGGSDITCSSDLSRIYVYDPLDSTLTMATCRGKIVRGMNPVHGPNTRLECSPSGDIITGLEAIGGVAVLTFFDFLWEHDVSEIFRIPRRGWSEKVNRPVIANDGTAAFSVPYTVGSSRRNVFFLFKEDIEFYLDVPGDINLSYDLSEDGNLLAICKSDGGVYLYQKNSPLWGIQKKCRHVELGKEGVLVECFENEKDAFPKPYVFNSSGDLVWNGEEEIVTSSISRDGKLVAYLDIQGRLRIVRID